MLAILFKLADFTVSKFSAISLSNRTELAAGLTRCLCSFSCRWRSNVLYNFLILCYPSSPTARPYTLFDWQMMLIVTYSLLKWLKWICCNLVLSIFFQPPNFIFIIQFNLLHFFNVFYYKAKTKLLNNKIFKWIK